VRVSSFRVILLAGAIVVVSGLPQNVCATSNAFTQSPGEFNETGTQAIEVLPFRDASSARDSSFTESLLDSKTAAAVSDAVLVSDKSKPSRDDKFPGSRVPEPGTFFLAVAGLTALARFSGKTKLSSQ